MRRIYQEFLDGYGYYQISRRLTEDGVPTERGLDYWNWDTVKKILTNEKYMGDTKCQKTYNVDHLTKKRVKNNGELPQYYYENTHPAIIDRDIWQCVQLEFEKQDIFVKEHRMGHYHQHSLEMPMVGKIICGSCGDTFLLRELVNGKFWRCINYRSQGTCSNGIKIGVGKIEDAFVSAWNKFADGLDKQIIDSDGKDILPRYRAKELLRLINDIGHIDTMPYELMLKTLSHIEVDTDAKVSVVFLAGTSVKMQGKEFIYKQRAYHNIAGASWMALRRMELGLTQQQLADKVGVGYNQILRIEKDANTSKATAMKLGEIMGIPWMRWFER